MLPSPHLKAHSISSPRIIFANQLRALAVGLVVISHLCGLFWYGRDVVSAATLAPSQPGPAPEWVALLLNGVPWNPGPLGVAIFFLISGFVIPFSLARLDRPQFIRARLLRIYPTYLVGLILQLAVVYAASVHWGHAFTLGARKIIANAMLLQGLAHVGSLDLVNWTLVVELLFYAAAALIAPWLRRGWVWPIMAGQVAGFALSLACAAFAQAHPLSRWIAPMTTGSVYALSLGFMGLGVVFHFHVRGLISGARAAGAIALGFALFWLGNTQGLPSGSADGVPENAAAALALFTLSYVLRRHFRPWPLIDWLAGISFPLYLVHSLIGYTILRLLMLGFGWSYGVSLLAALAVVGLIAQGLHMTVERWSIALGHRRSPG